MRSAASGSPTAPVAVLGERRAFRACRRHLGVVADGYRAETRNRHAGELDHRHPDVRGEAGASLPQDPEERDQAVPAGDERGNQPARIGGEVVRRRVVDPVVLDEDRVARLQDFEDHALEDQEAGQRHDERRHADLRHDRSLTEADEGDDPERQQDRHPAGKVVPGIGELELGDGDRRNAAHVGDREIDLAEQKDEHHPERDHRHPGHLQDDVDEVGGGEEVRRRDAEVHDDPDLRENDREHAEVSRPDVADGPLPEALVLGVVSARQPDTG